MRWKVDKTGVPLGAERTVRRFLIFPTRLGREWRWLERVGIRQKVVDLDVGGSMEWGNYVRCWADYAWAEERG